MRVPSLLTAESVQFSPSQINEVKEARSWPIRFESNRPKDKAFKDKDKSKQLTARLSSESSSIFSFPFPTRSLISYLPTQISGRALQKNVFKILIPRTHNTTDWLTDGLALEAFDKLKIDERSNSGRRFIISFRLKDAASLASSNDRCEKRLTNRRLDLIALICSLTDTRRLEEEKEERETGRQGVRLGPALPWLPIHPRQVSFLAS